LVFRTRDWGLGNELQSAGGGWWLVVGIGGLAVGGWDWGVGVWWLGLGGWWWLIFERQMMGRRTSSSPSTVIPSKVDITCRAIGV
jgi:hypothetical protein